MDDEARQVKTCFDTLTPTQRVFVMARARGLTVAKAATLAGVARNTPATNWDTDTINGAILEIQEQMVKDAAQALQHIVPAAVFGLEAAVHMGDLNAIKEVLNRVWGKPIERKEVSGPDGSAIPLTFIQTLNDAYGGDDDG